jgi:ribose-phosphate pyrophosphokinase
MMVLEGPAANGMGKSIAGRLSCDFGKIEHKLFPDGESYIRMPPVIGDSFAVVQSTYAPSEKHLVELLFMIDALRDMNKKEITAVVPYLAYSRQDRRFREGEAISINTVLRLLADSGIGRLITVEPHRKEPFSSFSGKYTVIDPVEKFAEVLSERIKSPFIIATDEGDMERAKRLADLMECDYDFIEKERDPDSNQVSAVSSINSDLSGKEAVIYDDVISTGGTIELAAKIAISNGAAKAVAVASHLVMAGNAYERMISAGISEIYGSNTVPFSRCHVIDVSGLIAETLVSE